MYELNNTMALGIDSEAIRDYDRKHEIEKQSLSSEATTTTPTSETTSETTVTSDTSETTSETTVTSDTSETTSESTTTTSDSGKSSGQSLDDLVAYYDKLDEEIKALGSDEVMEKWLDKLEKNALDQIKFVLNMRNLMNLQKERVKEPMAVFLKQIEKI